MTCTMLLSHGSYGAESYGNSRDRDSLGILPLNIGGTIDRMDSKDDTLRIVDYKTGGTPRTPENIEQLFVPADNRPNYIFQTFLYAAIMCRKQTLKVAPSLLYIHRAASENYSPVIEMGAPRQPKIPVSNFAFYEDEFRERLSALLKEIYNPEETFSQTEDNGKCEYCDFRSLCKNKGRHGLHESYTAADAP